jgi:hypothetical protein
MQQRPGDACLDRVERKEVLGGLINQYTPRRLNDDQPASAEVFGTHRRRTRAIAASQVVQSVAL